MALKNFLHKRTELLVEERGEEQDADPGRERPGVVSIGDVVPRRRTTVIGEITSVDVAQRGGVPWLEATVADGTGTLVATWTGRREIAGIRVGQRLVVTGRASASGADGGLLVLNPLYELL